MQTVRVDSVRSFVDAMNRHLHRSPQRTGWACPVCGGGNDRLQLFNSAEHGDRAFDGPWRVRFYCRHGHTHSDGKQAYSAETLFREHLGVDLVLDGITWDEIGDGIPRQFLSGGVGGSRARTVSDMRASERFSEVQIAELRVKYGSAVKAWRAYQKTQALSAATINHFKLGIIPYGDTHRLAIPIPLTDKVYAVKKYLWKPEEDPRPDRKYDAPGGMPTQLFLENSRADYDVVDTSVMHIAEGEKTLMALHQMNLVPICTTISGSATWLQEWTRFFLQHGVKVFRVFSDDDEAGDQYVYRIRETLLKEQALALGEYDDVVFEYTRWPNFGSTEGRSKRDGYDVLADLGEEAGRSFLEAMLTQDLDTAPAFHFRRSDRYIPDITNVPAEQRAQWTLDLSDQVVTTVDQLRAETGEFSLAESLYRFATRYADEYVTIEEFPAIDPATGDEIMQRVKRGLLKLVKLDPGIGKTVAGVRLAERIALDAMVEWEAKEKDRLEAYENLKRAIDDDEIEGEALEAAERKLKHLSKPASKLTVVYAGLRKDTWSDLEQMMEHPELWYNWLPRNQHTCELFEMQQRIAQRGYSIMHRLCKADPDKGGCEAAQRCHEERGRYMNQLEERCHEFPILFVRSQNLRLTSVLGRAKLIIVDEDPHHVWLQTHQVTRSDFTTDADIMDVLEGFDKDQQRMVMALNFAFKRSLQAFAGEDKPQRGYAVMRAIDAALMQWPHGTMNLLDVVGELESEVVERLETRTPEQLRDFDTALNAPSYHFNTLLRLVLEEAETYYRQAVVTAANKGVIEDWNSRVNIVNGAYMLLPLDPFDLPQETPIVALDATGTAAEYELSFQRPVDTTRYLVRHPDTETIVLTGSEWTKTATMADITAQAKLELLRAEQTELADTPTAEPSEPVQPTNDLEAAFAAVTSQFLAIPKREEDEEKISKVLKGVLAKIETVLLALCAEHPGEDIFVVTYMGLEKWINETFAELHPTEFARLHVGHFYGLKGTNRFKHLKVGIVIGTPRLNGANMDMVLSAMFYGQRLMHTPPEDWDGDDWEPYDLVPVPYHMAEGNEGYWLRTALDQRAQVVIDKYVAGEMWQCATRIRPHTSPEGKTLYTLTAYPSMLWVTETRPYSQIVRDRRIENHVADYVARVNRGERMSKSRRSVLSKAFVRDELNCSDSMAGDIAKQVNELFKA